MSVECLLLKKIEHNHNIYQRCFFFDGEREVRHEKGTGHRYYLVKSIGNMLTGTYLGRSLLPSYMKVQCSHKKAWGSRIMGWEREGDSCPQPSGQAVLIQPWLF